MEQRYQDPVERILLEHAQVTEWLEQMRAAAGFLYHGEQAHGVERLRIFYRNNVRKHFDYEEQQLFPALRAACPSPELNEALDEYLDEHSRLLPRLDELLLLLDRPSTASPREPAYRETLRRARLVIDHLMVHAANEDDVLLPLLERHRDGLVAWLGVTDQRL